jgi:dipeptidyl aminopeptidase/acylaminoacyl peptidase
MVALSMHTRLRGCIVTVAICLGLFAVACGGSGGGDVGPLRDPSPVAPRDVITFGAVGGEGGPALYLVQSDGTGIQALTSEDEPISFPRWSPDGARIAYVAGESDGASLRVYNFDGAITTTVSEQLLASGEGAPIAWSPDGARIAFINVANGGTLRIFDFERGSLLDQPSVPATAVAWSTRGEIAVVAPPGDDSSTNIYTLGPNESEPELRLELEGHAGGLAWSPDAELLGFWSAPSTQLSERRLMTLAGGAESAEEIAPGTDPTWALSGQLAYSGSAAGERGALDVYARDGGRLTQALTLDRWASWAPTEDALAYLGEADPSTRFLCIITLETRDNTCLDLDGLTPTQPVWSPY